MKINALPPGIITLQDINNINTITGGYTGYLVIMTKYHHGEFITLRYSREEGKENNR